MNDQTGLPNEASPADGDRPSGKPKTNATWIRRILQEPLLHFLVLAVGLFAAYHLWSDSVASESPDSIVVTEQRINSLAQMFQRTWQRPPTPEELNGLIEDYVKEEVFYREALRMGLDRDDTIIRRRMRQKLEFLAEDFADASEPTEQDLQEFLDDHPDSFRIEDQFTFRQVFLSPERRGESLTADAEVLLQQLRNPDTEVEPSEHGDPTLLPDECDGLRESEVNSQFGSEFTEQLAALDEGQWSGPVKSAFGYHLVFVRERVPGRQAELADVRQHGAPGRTGRCAATGSA